MRNKDSKTVCTLYCVLRKKKNKNKTLFSIKGRSTANIKRNEGA